MSSPTAPPDSPTDHGAAPRKKDRSHWLYIGVIIGVIAGILVGWLAPDVGKNLKVLGDLFISLIKMTIAPIIFCTIVLGIGSVREAATVGKAGGLALIYFLIMSTFALAIGLVVGNIVSPGHGLNVPAGGADKYVKQAESGGSLMDFVAGIIPDTLFSALTGKDKVLQALFVALIVGFAVQSLGAAGRPAVEFVRVLQRVVFKVLSMLLWLAPIGAFGAMAGLVGNSGLKAVVEVLKLMGAFYLTCILFVGVILGLVLFLVTRLNIFKLLKYLAREFLLIVATSSSESALPNLIAKMQHLGVDRATVGIVVPTGYSFNLDGTAIYLTMSSIFISDAMGKPMSLGEQIGLLVFMIIASKGAAGVSGAGLATLAAGLSAHRPDLVNGVGIVVGIDRFMSEARALTNFAGNSVATVLVGTWTRTIDRERVDRVLAGDDPFDYTTMTDSH